MARGDQIYVMRPFIQVEGVYEHHGIDCGNGTVIHYSKAEGEPTIRRTSLKDFAWGNPIRVKPYTVSYIPDVVIQRAESRLGERRYDLMTNNCEHFANWCKAGRNESEQLSNYGLGTGGLDLTSARRLMEGAAEESDPMRSLELFTHALNNVAIARTQLQLQADQSQKDMNTWHRVANLALQQGKEPVARAALERKLEAKRRGADYQAQLKQMDELAADLRQSSDLLQQRLGLTVQQQGLPVAPARY
jgi:hypothetical protein